MHNFGREDDEGRSGFPESFLPHRPRVPIDLTLALFGLLVLVLGLFSRAIKGRLPISDSLIALAVGILVGPSVAGWLDLRELAEPERILHEAARVTLAIGLMAIALRLPKRALSIHRFTLATLMLVVMPLCG